VAAAELFANLRIYLLTYRQGLATNVQATERKMSRVTHWWERGQQAHLMSALRDHHSLGPTATNFATRRPFT
jgi:hypothetical protein